MNNMINHAHSYKEAVEPACIYYIYYIPVYEVHMVCAEFVPRVLVLHFMPTGWHFACVQTVYRVRQRILTAYQNRTRSFFCIFCARPPVNFGDYELTGTKKGKMVSLVIYGLTDFLTFNPY